MKKRWTYDILSDVERENVGLVDVSRMHRKSVIRENSLPVAPVYLVPLSALGLTLALVLALVRGWLS